MTHPLPARLLGLCATAEEAAALGVAAAFAGWDFVIYPIGPDGRSSALRATP